MFKKILLKKEEEMKKYLFGIQPTGKLHIGHYLGGIKKALELQEDNEVEFLIAQHHALTTKTEEYKDTMSNLIESDLKRLGASKIIYQSSKNTLLAFKIMCITPFYELKHMIQFKQKGNGNVGLFVYPCLMAADIILSNSDYVICGEDQKQHIEFYRKTCKRLKLEKKAEIFLTKTPRIMSIKNPKKKMSNSLEDKHCLYLFEDNKNKIMKAPTDDEGVKNLENIMNELNIKFDSKNCKESKEKLHNWFKNYTSCGKD